MGLMLYIAVACVVWLVAIVLAFSKGTRALAKKIPAGMAGSFPGVFLFQLLSAPFLALVMLIVYVISHYSKSPDVVIVILIL